VSSRSSLRRIVAAASLCLCAVVPASAELSAAQRAALAKYAQAIDRLPVAQRNLLSSGVQNLYHLAKQTQGRQVGPGINPAVTANARAQEYVPLSVRQSLAAQLATGVAHVSNPAMDYTLSIDSGFTQSESSTAWCGDSVVVGYNDSGAPLRTAYTTGGAGSFDGVAVSVDAGRSFRALDYLNPGTDPNGFLQGDPVLGCTSPQNFYYSSLDVYIDTTAETLDTIVTVSNSSDGGILWTAPSFAVSKDAQTHVLDKDWMFVSPAHPNNLYVTYTDFDYDPATCLAGQFRTAIEMVRSSDAGNTWSQPVVVEQDCYDFANGGLSVQGSQVLVDKWGHVLVAYEVFSSQGPRAIRIARSTNGGASFAKPVQVSAVVPTGDGNLLQAGFRTNEFPSLAADPRTGELYVAWADGRDRRVEDAFLAYLFGIFYTQTTYNFSSVLVSRSTNGGTSWSAPTRVTPQNANYGGLGRDAFMPGIAVDKTGKVAVCYYDRRNDPDNQDVDRYCSVSTDGGVAWIDERKTLQSWTPVQSSDQGIAPTYMGDYDSTVADALGQYTGFAGGFQIQTRGNPDVYLARF
jgi:hypothetical protein